MATTNTFRQNTLTYIRYNKREERANIKNIKKMLKESTRQGTIAKIPKKGQIHHSRIFRRKTHNIKKCR